MMKIMEFMDALEKANNYFLNVYNQKVNKAVVLDAVTHWIFYPGEEEIVEFGVEGVKIEKSSGKMDPFILPDDENFELLDRATKIKMEE